MRVLLASISQDELSYFEGFMAGVESSLRQMPNPSGNDPVTVVADLDTHQKIFNVYLVTGKWIGPHEASFDNN